VEPAGLRRRGDRPHLRVENRVLPAGPSVVDVLANAAFYYGAGAGARRQRAAGVDSDVVPGCGAENFTAGATHGIDAQVYWPGRG
jgi:hypothetical protein